MGLSGWHCFFARVVCFHRKTFVARIGKSGISYLYEIKAKTFVFMFLFNTNSKNPVAHSSILRSSSQGRKRDGPIFIFFSITVKFKSNKKSSHFLELFLIQPFLIRSVCLVIKLMLKHTCDDLFVLSIEAGRSWPYWHCHATILPD